jgi:hypothetical protein
MAINNHSQVIGVDVKEYWVVNIQGTNAPKNYTFNAQTTFSNREEAQACLKEAVQQIIESGEIHALNNKLLDKILEDK